MKKFNVDKIPIFGLKMSLFIMVKHIIVLNKKIISGHVASLIHFIYPSQIKKW